MKKINTYKTNIDVYSGYRSKQSIMLDVINSRNSKEMDDAFYIADLGDIVRKYRDWRQILPAIEPFYAVKCNEQAYVLKVLADLGCNFDCASKHEMERVLKLGVSPDRIIFANPVKQVSFIQYARKNGVDLMTFDNEMELRKIKAQFPTARLILRILPPSNFKVQCELGMKFGCMPSKAQHLLNVAKQLDLNIVGISFHVGSGCEDASAFKAAIREAASVYTCASDMGFNVSILDIGGGFPGQPTAPVPFLKIADVVTSSLAEYFPDTEGLRVIAEPGRYFVASAFTLAVNIIAKRTVARDDPESANLDDITIEKPTPCKKLTANDEPAFMYYVNDGVYGSFNCILYDHATVHAQALTEVDSEAMLHTCSIWGPTCDGLDCVLKDTLLPELNIGDWLFFEDMGAYTLCAASMFNGMPRSKCYFNVRDDYWCNVNHPSDACTCSSRHVPDYSEDLSQLIRLEI